MQILLWRMILGLMDFPPTETTCQERLPTESPYLSLLEMLQGLLDPLKPLFELFRDRSRLDVIGDDMGGQHEDQLFLAFYIFLRPKGPSEKAMETVGLWPVVSALQAAELALRGRMGVKSEKGAQRALFSGVFVFSGTLFTLISFLIGLDFV